MATIYSAPETIKKPEMDFTNMGAYKADNERFIKELKDLLLTRKKGKNVGEIIRFPVADGYAEYMVASMRPLELVHLPIYDAWEYPYINRLTAEDVNNKIAEQNAMERLFAAKRKEI
jgi:hypothetical protein